MAGMLLLSPLFTNFTIGYLHSLQLTPTLLRNLDNNLSPSPPTPQRYKCILNPIQPNKLLITILSPLHLALLHKIHNPLPNNRNSLNLILGIRTPMDPHKADVLQ